MKRQAFTLTEVLVVTVVTAIIAATLLPVLVNLKESSKKAVCLSNFRQTYLAVSLYLQDYDDFYMPVNHQPATEPNSRNDRTWVQLLLPYSSSFSIFHCPSDSSPKTSPESTFDTDLVPGDPHSQFYTASLRANVGYNYLYLSPVIKYRDLWMSAPRAGSQVVEPGNTLIFIDSVWALNSAGRPVGGGNWLVIPPCRYSEDSGDSFNVGLGRGYQYFTINEGWQPEQEDSAFRYGGAWPWHQNLVTTIRADGSARMMSLDKLSEGCNVLPHWAGLIYDELAYPWDIR